MKRWEYKVMVVAVDHFGANTEDSINAAGMGGWELVAVTRHPQGMAPPRESHADRLRDDYYEPRTAMLAAWFKRERCDATPYRGE